MADDYLLKVKGLSPEKKTEQMETIQKLFTKSREYGDDKVQLAMQTYEMVASSTEKVNFIFSTAVVDASLRH